MIRVAGVDVLAGLRPPFSALKKTYIKNKGHTYLAYASYYFLLTNVEPRITAPLTIHPFSIVLILHKFAEESGAYPRGLGAQAEEHPGRQS